MQQSTHIHEFPALIFMHLTRPLPGHPEYSVTEYQGYCEYRVENWYIARNRSGKVVRRATDLTWFWAVLPVLFALTPSYGQHWVVSISLVTLFLLYRKCTQVVEERVIVIPPHGIQLETRRGLPSWPISTSRRFIPLTMLKDTIINEGLYGWDVRYYLAAVKRHPTRGFSLDVMFENILPRMPVLLDVYHGIREMLLNAQGEDGRCPNSEDGGCELVSGIIPTT